MLPVPTVFLACVLIGKIAGQPLEASNGAEDNPSVNAKIPPDQGPRPVSASTLDTEWIQVQANLQKESRWKTQHARPATRVVYSADLHMLVFLPGPPLSVSGISGFIGYELVPKFIDGKILRRREIGYWGTFALNIPNLQLIDRHMIALAGSRSKSQGPFMQTGMGLVHRRCCKYGKQRHGPEFGFTVAAQGGWRWPTKSRRFSFLIGVPLVFEMFSTPRASLGVLVGIGTI